MPESGVLRIGNVAIDVQISERHDISMSVTQYAIENGNNVSDHIVENPNSLEIEFEMTNTDGGRDRAKRAFQEFVKLMQDKKPVQIITEHATYNNMVFTGFPSEHTTPNLGTLRGSARFEQIGIIGAENVITAGRHQSVLAGNGYGRDNVGAGGVSQLAPEVQYIVNEQGFVEKVFNQLRDATYRTAVNFIDSGVQSLISDIKNPLVQKVVSKVADYGLGEFESTLYNSMNRV